jgi:hypothetical protein
LFQVRALEMYLETEYAEKSEEREWQVKLAMLTADPAKYGPIVFPAPKKAEERPMELQPGDLTVGGFSPDITVKYETVPTPEEVEEILAEINPEQVLGVEDFQFANGKGLTNGKS